jgi:SH3-like domain-containing protein
MFLQTSWSITLWYYLPVNDPVDPYQKASFIVTTSSYQGGHMVAFCFQGGKMIRPVFFAGILSLLLMACNFQATSPTPTALPTFTPGPTSTPIPTATATPAAVSLTVKDDLINCRLGPGTEYILVTELLKEQFAQALGRNDSATWLYIRDPGNPEGFCWVSTSVLETSGPVIELPIFPPPFVTVTDFNLRVEPSRILVNCSQFPQTVFLAADITTNGPTLLTWKWEASTGVVSDVGTLVFQEAGIQTINEYYQISGPNEYWVKLYVLTPNELVQQVNIPVSCTP